MEAMPVSKFKARCLAVMEAVRRTGRPVRVTRYGRPIVDVVSVAPPAGATRVLGFLADHTAVRGDIVSPISAPGDWEALR
jgi:prevent-host-death family protein